MAVKPGRAAEVQSHVSGIGQAPLVPARSTLRPTFALKTNDMYSNFVQRLWVESHTSIIDDKFLTGNERKCTTDKGR